MTAKDSARRTLLASLKRSTPFEIGVAEVDGANWQLIEVLTDDILTIQDGDLHDHRWHALVVESQRWLFLQVIVRKQKLNFWFAFECNSPVHQVFLKRVLRTKRLVVGFSNGIVLRLDPTPADSLVEDNGEILEELIPGWQGEYFPIE